MKLVLVYFLIFSATAAHSASTSVRAQDVTCSELKTLLEVEGVVRLNRGLFGQILVQNESFCNEASHRTEVDTVAAYNRVSDGWCHTLQCHYEVEGGGE